MIVSINCNLSQIITIIFLCVYMEYKQNLHILSKEHHESGIWHNLAHHASFSYVKHFMQQMMNFYIPSLYHIYPCKQVAMQQNIIQSNKMTFCHTAMLKLGITMSIQVINLPQLMRQFTFMSFLWFISAISQHIKVTHTQHPLTHVCFHYRNA